MSDDVSAELAGLIAKGKVFGNSDNIRHGIYIAVIKNIRAQRVEVDEGSHRFVFWEMSPIKSDPNPQTEGDRVDYKGPTDRGTGPLKDDGTKPNIVGSDFALKVDFDGAGSRSAPANSKAPILALFNKQEGEMSEADVAATFKDLERQKPVRKGEPIGFDPTTKQVVYAADDKQAQPARGMIIGIKTSVKKKKTANEHGAYITKLNFFCVAPIGTGVNSKEEVAKRRAEIELQLAAAGGDDEEEETSSSSNGSSSMPQMPVGAAPSSPPAGMQVPSIPPAAPTPPPPPVVAAPPPPPPWTVPPGWTAYDDPKYFGPTPETRFYHNGQQVKSEAQLRAGQ